MKLPIETIARIAKENHVLEQLSYTHAGHCVPWYEIQHKDYLIEFVNAISEATIREAQDGNEVEQISEKSKLPYPVTIAGGTVGKGCSWSTLILRIDSFNKAHSKTPNNSEVDELKALLKVANCPECDGGGVVQTPDEIHQCRWCHERESALATIGDK